MTDEMKKMLDEAPSECLITGFEKCESYLIDGNVVYLPRPAYDAYTLPEYNAEDRAFYCTKYDMDNDSTEEDCHICNLDDLIEEQHPKLNEIKQFYNIPDIDFVNVYEVCECDAVAAYSLDEALDWYKKLTGLTSWELYAEEEIDIIPHDHLVSDGENSEETVSVKEILRRHWKGEPFIAITTGGY